MECTKLASSTAPSAPFHSISSSGFVRLHVKLLAGGRNAEGSNSSVGLSVCVGPNVPGGSLGKEDYE